jgi:uncharacterized protein involved in outer membrane biogenesis
MKSPRKLLAFLVVALVFAAVVLVQTFNALADRNRDQVRQELQKVFGTDVNFDSLEVHWLGRLGFVAKEFRVADDPHFAATPLLRARELILGVSVWDLFFRRFVISALTFTEPEFQIITDESGSLNLTTLLNRKDELRRFPKLPRASTDRKQNAVSFVIGQIRINEGRVEYVDRSIKEPAELHLKHLSMTLEGFEPREATKIRLTASLTEGLSQDVKISGRFDPASGDLSWMHRRVDVNLQFDSLHVPVVARALAALRDKIPGELDVTGPMAFHAKVGGTLQRPRIDDITLKIPLFGSSDYNAVVNGTIHFTERRLWEDAAIQGKFAVEPLALARLRAVKFFEQNLPSALIADGTIGVYGRFEGTWKTLRLGVLLRAEKAELRYKDSLRKPLGAPAELRTQISRRNNQLSFHESELVVGAQRIGFSGGVDDEKPRRLKLIVHGERTSVPGWNALLTSSLIGVTGAADWKIVIQKTLSSSGEGWDVQGQVVLTGAEIRQKDTGGKIENLNAKVIFAGQQARLNEATFRIGRSLISLSGTVPNLLEPTMAYNLWSSRLNLADLPLLAASPPVELENMTASGVMQLQNERWICTGAVTAPQGSLNQIGFRDLRADMVLTAASLTFKNLSAQVLNGRLRSDGYWAAVNQRGQQLEFSPEFDGLEMRALIAQLFPPLAGRLEGQLQGRARFGAATSDGSSIKDALKGSGEASVTRGVIKDFNLVRELLLRGSGVTISESSVSRLPPGFAALVGRRDTPFESFTANFTVDQKQMRTEDLVVTTPDYTITGSGSIGFDRSTKWTGLLILSPRLSQEVQRDYRLIRYLLDRRGRLAISFRLEGKIPNVKIRLDNRALAQALRASSSGRADNKDTEAKRDEEPGEAKRWLPDALERFLNR